MLPLAITGHHCIMLLRTVTNRLFDCSLIEEPPSMLPLAITGHHSILLLTKVTNQLLDCSLIVRLLLDRGASINSRTDAFCR